MGELADGLGEIHRWKACSISAKRRRAFLCGDLSVETSRPDRKPDAWPQFECWHVSDRAGEPDPVEASEALRGRSRARAAVAAGDWGRCLVA